jgi:hypothetical protein
MRSDLIVVALRTAPDTALHETHPVGRGVVRLATLESSAQVHYTTRDTESVVVMTNDMPLWAVPA